MPESAQRGFQVQAKQTSAFEQEAGVAVLDRERKAELAVLGSELALEVSGPCGVGLRKNRERRTWMSPTAPWLPGLDAAMPLERPADGIDAGDRIDGGILFELRTDLLRSPAPCLPDRENAALNDGRRGGMRTGMGPMRAILEALEPFLLIASDPLVACGTADVVPPAELGVREIGKLGLDDEAGTLGFHG